MLRIMFVALALIWASLPATAAVLTLSCNGTMKAEEEQAKPSRRWSCFEPAPGDMRRMRFDEYRDRLRVGCNHPFALDLSCPINNADRRQLQRYVQSHIVFHRSSPSLRGHMRMASCVPGELIP